MDIKLISLYYVYLESLDSPGCYWCWHESHTLSSPSQTQGSKIQCTSATKSIPCQRASSLTYLCLGYLSEFMSGLVNFLSVSLLTMIMSCSGIPFTWQLIIAGWPWARNCPCWTVNNSNKSQCFSDTQPYSWFLKKVTRKEETI